MGGSVSIIIPTYNRSSYLRRAVESVLCQSYRELEVVVVDDASTDETEEVVASFDDARVVYLRNRENVGANVSRNRGLREATGDYVGFLDDDDYYVNDEKLSSQLALLAERPDLAFVGCGYWDASLETERYPRVRGDVAEHLLLSFSNIETSTILIRRDVVERVGLFDDALPSEQNHDFFYRVAKHGCFDYVDEVMVYKDTPPTQISSDPKKKLRGYVRFHRKHLDDIRYLPLAKKLLLASKFTCVTSLFCLAMIVPSVLHLIRKLDEVL